MSFFIAGYLFLFGLKTAEVLEKTLNCKKSKKVDS
jgi:hypothetical protein